MAKSVFFDTQIITGVSDGTLPATVWATIIGKLSGTYEYCASFTTFVELINALAEGDEARFDQNRKRLMLLTSPSGCRLLPMPGSSSVTKSSDFRLVDPSTLQSVCSKVGFRLSRLLGRKLICHLGML